MSLEVIVKGQGRGLCWTLVIQRELDKDVIHPWGFNHLQGQQNQPAESGSSENRRKLQIQTAEVAQRRKQLILTKWGGKLLERK